MTTTLANLLRSLSTSNLSRKQLKVLRAKLRRAGVTNLNHAKRNSPYTVNPHADVRADARADQGTVVVQVAAVVLGVAEAA